jgi:hypothetical protein
MQANTDDSCHVSQTPCLKLSSLMLSSRQELEDHLCQVWDHHHETSNRWCDRIMLRSAFSAGRVAPGCEFAHSRPVTMTFHLHVRRAIEAIQMCPKRNETDLRPCAMHGSVAAGRRPLRSPQSGWHSHLATAANTRVAIGDAPVATHSTSMVRLNPAFPFSKDGLMGFQDQNPSGSAESRLRLSCRE